MVSESDLLARGYFPREVQPTFESVSLAAFSPAISPANLTEVMKGKYWTEHSKHNLARPGGLRRTLSIPNPGAYMRIARSVAGAWSSELEPIIDSSVMAGSKLIPSTGPRTVEAWKSKSELELWRAEKRTAARYLLHSDVLNFYPSLYTHAIDWVVHGKDAAKAALEAGTKTVGSKLDKAFRDAQEKQTIGLPVGPDASLIVAECTMTRIEHFLLARMPSVSGYRYWDDFELSFSSLADAESGLTIFQEALEQYGLAVNPRKTRIAELPEAQLTEGSFDFGDWDLSGPTQRRQLVGYFDELFRCIQKDRGSHVAAYAVARLRSVSINSNNWEFVQRNLLQLLVAEPSCARFVAELLGVASSSGDLIANTHIAQAAERLAAKHAPLGHGSEIAWALWICIANDVPLTAATATAVSMMSDNLVALLALHAHAKGLVPSGLSTANWATVMTTAELRRSNWLLAYEASIKGWLPSVGGVDHVGADPLFQLLRTNDVSFYNEGKLNITTAATLTGGGGATGGGGYV